MIWSLLPLSYFLVVGRQLGRQHQLDSPDALNRIIRARIPKKRMLASDKWDGVDESTRDLTLWDLVTLLEEHLRLNQILRSVVGKETEKPGLAEATSDNELESA